MTATEPKPKPNTNTEVTCIENLTEGDIVEIRNMEIQTSGTVERLQEGGWSTDSMVAYVACDNGYTVTLTMHGRDNPLVAEGITSNVGGSVTVTTNR